MSQENVELVRQAFAAFARRDRDAWLSCCDPAMESSPSGDWPETATVRGREAVWDFYVQADEPWEPGAYDLAEVIDVDRSRVLVHQVRDMRGKDSGAAVRYDYWVMFEFRAGKAVQAKWFPDRADA